MIIQISVVTKRSVIEDLEIASYCDFYNIFNQLLKSFVYNKKNLIILL